MNGSLPNRTDAMRLAPKRSPGRSTRKARAFAAEIAQLRAQGYTYEAIREALAEAGVQVSKSTVQREVSRPEAIQPAVRVAGVGVRAAAASEAALAPEPASAPITSAGLHHTADRNEHRSGKDIAEAFLRERITNPLLRAKSTKEPR